MKPAKRSNVQSYAFFEKLSVLILERTVEASYSDTRGIGTVRRITVQCNLHDGLTLNSDVIQKLVALHIVAPLH